MSGKLVYVDSVKQALDEAYGEGNILGLGIILNTVSAVDAVEVVRCSQCQHWKKDVAGCTDLDFIGRCELANYFVGATGFCVYGERREENEVD